MEEPKLSNNLAKIKNVDITRVDIDRIIFLTENLIKLLENESEMLSAMDLTNFTKIYQEKIKFIDELEIHQKIIEKRPNLLKAVNNLRLEYLKGLQCSFNEACARNKKLIEIAISINKKVVESIKKAVTNHLETKGGYAKNGDYAVKSKLEEQIPPFNLNSVI